MRVLPYGAAAVLFEAEPDEVRAVAAALRRRPPVGALDVVPAERTVLVRVVPGTDLTAVRAHVRTLAANVAATPDETPDASVVGALPTDDGERARSSPPVPVPVRYDGADLDHVAELTGLSPAQVVAAHTATPWTVAFCGFAPGFAYLTGGDPRLAVPRRPSPRALVPRGSVALAGPYSAVYPGDSPGGWQLIGRTDAPVWDLARDPPALLRPGVRVSFVDAAGTAPGPG